MNLNLNSKPRAAVPGCLWHRARQPTSFSGFPVPSDCLGTPAADHGLEPSAGLVQEAGGDVHRALLVTGIPEGLEPAAIEAVLRPAVLLLGAFRLRNTSAVSQGLARAALVEFVEDIDHAAIPREIPADDGVWRVLCRERAEDSKVLRQMERLLPDERPGQAAEVGTRGDTLPPPAGEAQAQGQVSAQVVRRGRRGGRNRARGNRLALEGKKRGRGGRPAAAVRQESEDSPDRSLGVVIRAVPRGDWSEGAEQSALYATLQAAAGELVKKWVLRREVGAGDRPREFLALVTVTDKTKKEELEKQPPGAESISLNLEEAGLSLPELVALLAVREAWGEEPTDSDTSESEWQESGDLGKEMDNPEFVAIVAYTDPSDPAAREEMLKIASVIQALGWSDKNDRKDVLPELLSVMAKDASGTHVKVEEAGREVDAMVLRKAKDDGKLLECVSTLAAPETAPKGRRPQRGLLRGWVDDEDAEGGLLGEDGGGLLELVALLAARDVAGVMAEEKENAWQGGKYKYARGNLGEVLALLAARENLESEESEEGASEEESAEASEASESEESESRDPASGKPRAKRARTSSRVHRQAGAARVPAPSGAPTARAGGRGPGGRGVARERKAGNSEAVEDPAAGSEKKRASAAAGAHAKVGETRAQPPARSKSARGKKPRRGRRLPPKCR